MGRPDFKPGWGCLAVPGRFDSCSLPPLWDCQGQHLAVAAAQQCGPIVAVPLAIAKRDRYD